LFSQLPIVSLVDQKSEHFNLNAKSDKIRIVSFFFSRCGTICPPTHQNLQRVLENFKNQATFQINSITIDPVYDTPSQLAKYASDFNLQNGKWKFLTGDKKTIYDFAIKGCKLPVADAANYDAEITNIDETFIHSDKLLLIDKEGYFRGIYKGTDNIEIDRLIVEIKVLLNQKK
jgi:protein SCO1